MSSPGQHPTRDERDERVAMPLDPETALRALLEVGPDASQLTEAKPLPRAAVPEDHSKSEP